MAVGSVSVQQLLRRPYILRVISRLKEAGTAFQNFYNLGQGTVPSEVIPVGIHTFTYDVFDNTRTVATVRPRGAGPNRVRKQRVGTASATLLRAYEAMTIEYDKIAGSRRIGADWVKGLDRRGQNYVTKQLRYQMQRFVNLREFVISRMFRGGYAIKMEGEEHYVTEEGSGDFDVNFQIPSSHKGRLPLKAGAADIITASHASASTDVISHWLELQKAAERESGHSIKTAWINSTLLGNYIQNDTLQAAGGSAFRIWDDFQRGRLPTPDGSRDSGWEIQFRAYPHILFRVYDGVLNAGSVQVDSTAIADTNLFVPDNVCIFTPNPDGDWLGMAEGSELVRKGYDKPVTLAEGFDTWNLPVSTPAGEELHALDLFAPVLYIPKAVYYATVVF